MKNIINKIVNKIDYISILILCIIYTKIAYVKCYLHNTKIGKDCNFFGNIYLMNGNGGLIKIEKKCTFRSWTTSNSIGLNHRCMLSCTPANGTTNITNAYLEIGNHCGFSGVSIWCFFKIIIGNNVRVGANCLIMDGDAHFDDYRTAPPKPIIIEDNVFIGANCVIKKGVTIGQGAIIGMNSVVTHDIPANAIAVGIPAKAIKTVKST